MKSASKKLLLSSLIVLGAISAGTVTTITNQNQPVTASQTAEPAGSIKISTTFPDPKFQETLRGWDRNGDGYLSPDEIQNITYISLNGVNNAEGIKKLTSVQRVSVSNSGLSTLDLNGMSSVTRVEYSDNPNLKMIDLRNCPNLVTAYHSNHNEIVWISAGMTKFTGCDQRDEHTGNVNIDFEGLTTIHSDGTQTIDLSKVLSDTFLKVYKEHTQPGFNPDTNILTIPKDQLASKYTAGKDDNGTDTTWTFYTKAPFSVDNIPTDLTSEETKTVRRTVNYRDASGKLIPGHEPITDTITYHRTISQNLSTMEVSKSDWVADSVLPTIDVPQELDSKYEKPQVNNKEIQTIDGATPVLTDDPSDQNFVIDVLYSNKKESTTEHKSAKRTINFKDKNGNLIPGKQPIEEEVHYHRTATTDLVTGDVIYTDWVADDAANSEFAGVTIPQSFDQYNNPTVDGKSVTGIDAAKPKLNADGTPQDETIDVVFDEKEPTPTPTPDQPVTPSPKTPVAPATPASPSSTTPATPAKEETTAKSTTAPALAMAVQEALPETAKQFVKKNVLGLSAVAIATSSLVFFLTKKRH
ncbi:mucin-binding protein [Fructobacillus durionis]|uniref:EF-hand domain-containing protein n=1 Tax=Fructobacillus durionis TaxID=283737 RepID=A0A1I1GPI3_9LACO|nr:hypothetical protein [Fructobacillus durionis]SFC13411.1 hypothetical protein SAMN05660453_1135 [Fructobacillus durionis]